MLFIGIDLGTSAVKLLLMDAQGNILKITSKEYALSFPHPGWSEQNPVDWYEQTMLGLKELLEGCDKNSVAGISFGGQMHGFSLVRNLVFTLLSSKEWKVMILNLPSGFKRRIIVSIEFSSTSSS